MFVIVKTEYFQLGFLYKSGLPVLYLEILVFKKFVSLRKIIIFSILLIKERFQAGTPL